MPASLTIWWQALSAAAILDVLLWSLSALTLLRAARSLRPDVLATRRLLLWLSAGYVLGCGFRAWLPMVDVPRMCLDDPWVARIAVGRSVATAAELCFAAQWALLLREGGRATGSPLARFAASAVLPLIVLAECFSWSAVITRDYLLHAIENSLWTLVAFLVVAGFWVLRTRVDGRARTFLLGAAASGVVYIAFMLRVDVPMYLARWRADSIDGQTYLSFDEGLREILRRCTVVNDWATWQPDVPWLTLYFTVAVWISVLLPHAPALSPVIPPTPVRHVARRRARA